jgi:N-acetylneuraminic acid mutarotase
VGTIHVEAEIYRQMGVAPATRRPTDFVPIPAADLSYRCRTSHRVGGIVRHAPLAVMTLFGFAAAIAGEPAGRTLTFEDRVRAQEAIERVYYAHQIEATKPFEDAIPRAVLETKVRTYLDQTAALQTYWKTPITDEMLQRELGRMARGTRMPERLLELYGALGNDPFLIKECLARAALVDRLSHNFYAFDPTLHADARHRADEIRRRLSSGDLDPTTEHANRTATRIVLTDGVDRRPPENQPIVRQLTRDDFEKSRAEFPVRAGQPSALQEAPDAFSVSVLLSENAGELRVATYTVAKTSWDAWWKETASTLRGKPCAVVASRSADLPRPSVREQAGSGGTCPGDDTWDRWILREVPTARRNHTTVWTGSVVVIWGGFGATGLVGTGSRYDPATDTWLSMSTAGAPSARQFHRAVWTGASMVAWGGRGASNAYLGDGGRYDPVADAWLPVSLAGAPAARSSFTAIWTGTRMAVWGGSNAAGLVPAGGLYDPANDVWAPMSTTGAPAPRSGHSVVWTGSRMIVWGGFAPSATSTGGLYDPASDTWTPTSTLNAPVARSGHVAVWTGSLMVVWGGSATAPLDTGGRYDPANDSWTATSITNAPSSASSRTAIWTGAVMVIWGGSVTDPSDGSASYPADGGRYDPAGDTWAPTSMLGVPPGRTGQTPVWTGSSMIVWGGSRVEGPEFTTRYLDTGARYDPVTDAWTPTSLIGTPRARYEHSAIWTGNVMVIWGGTDANTDFGTGGRYDPVTDDWTGTSTLNAPSGRYRHSAIWTGSAMVVWGGANRLSAPDWCVDTGGTYDPIADTWAAISTVGAPSKRVGHAAVWTGREMLVWGGSCASTYLSTGARYDPASNSWAPMSTQGAPPAREKASAVWTGGLMLVWGGNGAGPSCLDTGGRYDPSRDTWTPTSLVGAPTGRWFHSTVWTGQTMVVWGGERREPDGTSILLDSGGRYDPDANAWTATSTTGAPSARLDHAAVWTGRDMVVWGGYGGTYLGTGGRYDPNADTWTATSTVDAPSARTGHTAVWDGHEALVWGGYENASPFVLVDTGASYHATPGEACNGADDDCDGAVDEGGDALCDDHNPCTDDACNGGGGCVFVAHERPCDDENPCTAADTCGGGACSGTPLTGTSCDDGNACTVGDACAAGTCASGSPLPCDDGDRCTDDACDPATGCVVLGPRTCDDGNVCTDDSCNPSTGCVFTPHGGPCDDGSPCTTDEACQGGQCLPTRPPCDDGNPCTDDVCNPWGCNSTPNTAPCDDGYECTVGDTCSNRTCIGTPTYGSACDDHNACSTDDVCNGWSCYGTYRNCNDDNTCTDDWCDPASGECAFSHNDANYCSDGDLCTLHDSCHAGACTGSTPLDCYACPAGFERIGMLCRRTLNMTGGSLFNQSASCDSDGTNRYNDCDGGSYGFIFSDGGSNLIPVEIDLQFISGVSCDSGTSQVTLNGAPIGTFTPLGSCQCYPLRLLVSFPDIDVSAYVPGGINTIAIAPAGGCEGLTRWSDLGGNYGRITITYARHDPACGTGTCAPETGVCSFATLPDGTACGDACNGGGTCAGGACDAIAIDCDDLNACTDDRCDPATGCVFTDNANACDDGSPCTTGDSCSGGSCVGTPEPTPGEVVSVSAWKADTGAIFEWDATAWATAYDVLRGRVLDWPVGSNPNTETCVDNMVGTTLYDGSVPDAGDGYWYLVRGDNSCGSGSYGSQGSQGTPTVPRSSSACP